MNCLALKLLRNLCIDNLYFVKLPAHDVGEHAVRKCFQAIEVLHEVDQADLFLLQTSVISSELSQSTYTLTIFLSFGQGPKGILYTCT